jgi:NAD(P) transhydrogenase subunit alpha
MRIGVPLETRANETRVAATPETVKKFISQGHTVIVQNNAGVASSQPDAAYEAVGASIGSAADALGADIVLKVRAPDANELAQMKSNAVLLGMLDPFDNTNNAAMAAKGITAFALEAAPRTTRAQSLDVLSSQANIAGYKAVLVAANEYQRFMPMLMTAAGTVKAARILILGAGVAGLQAIATARRLGAVVSAYDVRPSSADEVRSMGAAFIELELESLEGAGGYAREMTEERAAKQRELLTPYISKSHVVITTAAVPNRRAPLLVTKEMYSGMVAGSVIVDLAAESGGNVEGSVAGEVIETAAGVRIWGGKDVPSQLPFHASSLYSKNLVNLMGLMIKSGETGSNATIALDFEDEIIAASAVTHAGEIRNEQARAHIQGEKAGKSS